MTPEERAAEGIDSLPQSLAEAVDVMEDSELVAEALGEHVFEYFIRNKRARVGATTRRRSRPGSSTATSGRCDDATRCTEPLLVFPDPPPPLLAQTLDLAGYPWKAVANASIAAQHEPADGWAGAVVVADEDPEGAFGICRALRKRDAPLEPILLLVSRRAARRARDARGPLRRLLPRRRSTPRSSRRALRHLFWRTGRATRPEIVEYGDLVLNLETYQAALGGRPLDLTYMEYELLKFFATHPGKVFTREQLLSRVWGYEYYGGARTVDVHVRRLRAKLGEEHGDLIQTVRSVGYRFGQTRSLPGGDPAPAQ